MTFLVVCNTLWTDFYVKDQGQISHENPMEVTFLHTPEYLTSLPLMSASDWPNHTTKQQKQYYPTRNTLQIVGLQLMLMKQLAASINHNTFHNKTPLQ